MPNGKLLRIYAKLPVANQEDNAQSLARTPLYQLGVELKARFTSFLYINWV